MSNNKVLVAGAAACVVLSTSASAQNVSIDSGSDITRVTETSPGVFEAVSGGSSARSLGVDVIYDRWSQDPEIDDVVLGSDSGAITTEADITFGIGKSLSLETDGTVEIESTITGSGIPSRSLGGTLNLGFTNDIPDQQLDLVVLGRGLNGLGQPIDPGHLVNIGEVNVNANYFAIEEGSSLTLGSGNYFNHTNQYMPGETVINGEAEFLNLGLVQQNDGNVNIGSTMATYSGGVYNMADGRLNAFDATIGFTGAGNGTMNQSGGTVVLEDWLYIEEGSVYNMTGGRLEIDRWVGGGDFNYSDGSLIFREDSLDLCSTCDLGTSLTADTGERFAATDLDIRDAGTVTLDGANVVLQQRVLVDTGSEFTQERGRLYAGSELDLRGDYTMNDGQLITGSINEAGGSFVYNGGGVLVTDQAINVRAGGLLGDTVLMDSVSEEFGARNMTVGTAAADSGTVIHSGNSDNIVENTLTINAGGTYQLDGDFSVLGFGQFAGDGKIDFNGGRVYIGSDEQVGTGGAFGTDLDLTAGKTLRLESFDNSPVVLGETIVSTPFEFTGERHTLTVDDGTLVLDGGALVAETVVGWNDDDFVSGILNLNTVTVDDVIVATPVAGGPTFSSLTLNGDKTLIVQDSLTVGDSGVLRIEAGGAVQGNNSIMNTGTIVLDGGDFDVASVANSGDGLVRFRSGDLSVDTLLVDSGGTLGSNVGIDSGQNLSANSIQTATGSSFRVRGGSVVAGAIDNGGVVRVESGASLGSSSATYEQGVGTNLVVDGTLSADVSIFDGTMSGSGAVDGDLALLGGSINPGNSPGALEISGDFSLDGGQLRLEVFDDGLTALIDQLIVAGSYNLDDGSIMFVLDGLDADALAAGFNIDDFLRSGTGISNTGLLESGFDFTTFSTLNISAWDLDTKSLIRLAIDRDGDFVVGVPVPAAVWLFGSALFALGWLRRRAA